MPKQTEPYTITVKMKAEWMSPELLNAILMKSGDADGCFDANAIDAEKHRQSLLTRRARTVARLSSMLAELPSLETGTNGG